MTDKELLELAAKASGFDVSHFDRDKRAMVVFAIDGDENPDQDYWNPLTNDGDALRLGIKCKILRCHMDLFHTFYEEEIASGFREYVATRRAIVRAAAEIGKAMK